MQQLNQRPPDLTQQNRLIFRLLQIEVAVPAAGRAEHDQRTFKIKERIMKKTLAILLIFSISSLSPYSGTQMRAMTAAPPQADQEYWEVQFSAEQLENLVAPVALYPDPLLAQVLVAATFPDQIDAASNEIRAYGNGYNIDDCAMGRERESGGALSDGTLDDVGQA